MLLEREISLWLITVGLLVIESLLAAMKFALFFTGDLRFGFRFFSRYSLGTFLNQCWSGAGDVARFKVFGQFGFKKVLVAIAIDRAIDSVVFASLGTIVMASLIGDDSLRNSRGLILVGGVSFIAIFGLRFWKKMSWSSLLIGVFLSVWIWAFETLAFYLLVGKQIGLSIVETSGVLLSAHIATLVSILPGGLGQYEGGAAVFGRILGESPWDIGGAAFRFHCLSLFVSFLCAFIGLTEWTKPQRSAG